jgi:hypothetical protein
MRAAKRSGIILAEFSKLRYVGGKNKTIEHRYGIDQFEHPFHVRLRRRSA